MKLKRFWPGILLGLAIAGLAGQVQAEEKTVKIMMPWDGEGNVYSIGVDRLLFMGEFEGVMYVESASGELDAAFANCPASQHIDLKNKQTTATGFCTITISKEAVVYSEWNCKGKLGACRGTMTLTGGTGKYSGITGSSDMIVRSVLSALVVGLGDGGAVRAASGLAIFPNMTFKLADPK